MENLITLVCPTCGGKLKVSLNATTLICQHCGNEHMVKHEAGGALSLEAYARCPVCGRNDRSEKVSAVLASQTQEISGTEQKQQVVTDAQGKQRVSIQNVPFTRKQITILGQRLAASPPLDPSHLPRFPHPPRPPSRGWAIALLLGGIVVGLSSVLIGFLSIILFALERNTYFGSSNSALIGLLLFVGTAFLFLVGIGMIVGGILIIKRTGQPNVFASARYWQQVEAVKREHTRIINKHNRAIERWNQLYYCARDDCIYIPGENNSAPVDEMDGYLFLPEPLLSAS